MMSYAFSNQARPEQLGQQGSRSKKTVDLAIQGTWVVTVDVCDSVHKNHTIIIDNGTIVDILPTTEASNHYLPEETVDREDHILMPGLINAHGHSAMTLFRGLADDLALGDWLSNHIWPAEKQWMSADFVTDGTQLALIEMIRGGTTCFSDMYFYPDHVAKAASEAKIHVNLCMPVLDFPTAWAQDAEEYIRKGLRVCDDFKHHPTVTTAFGPHAPYTVSDAPLEKIAMLAEELDVSIQIHLHETAQEIADAVKRFGQRPLTRLKRMGLLSPRLQAVHMTQLTEQDIETIQTTGTHVIHCPESNMKLASGICPATALSNAGVNMALGTDGAASNNDLDMFQEMRAAALLAKVSTNDATALPGKQALRCATINGAKALGIDHLTGSLERGKRADLIALDLKAPNLSPVHNVISQLVYAASASNVTDNWVAGKALMTNRTLLTLDENAILARAQLWREKISG